MSEGYDEEDDVGEAVRGRGVGGRVSRGAAPAGAGRRMGVWGVRAKQGRRSGEGEAEEVGLEDASPVGGGWASVEEAGQGKLGGVAGNEDEEWCSSSLWELG